PGRYVVLARRNGDKWYIAGTNGTGEAMKLDLDLSRFVGTGATVTVTNESPDGKELSQKSVKVKNPAKFAVTIAAQGGFVVESEKN
ncbi:glycoside hydrolase family 97 C-terminal domain-containing protein, partial [uncultured Duncaniella sp.]|uniref:glycoside hydrolase family 97 C-terminal domain-containing protein n=1 Tax=uncultured Duncaniella sp. TaxID=2768039 RepID=UPI00260620DE